MSGVQPSRLIEAAIAEYERCGFPVKFIIVTGNVLKRLIDEMGGAEDGFKKLKMSASSDPVLYNEREIIVCDLPSHTPILVAGCVPDQLSLYDLETK